MLKVIVGLGNPGPKYAPTRHNLGFMVVDAYARRVGAERGRKKFRSELRQVNVGGTRVLLLKPQTYMNLSGHAVRDLVHFHRLVPRDEAKPDLTDQLLVIYDDLDLPTGRLRYRQRGSAGGHRGVASIIQELNCERFSRLKVGIGRDERHEAADYVLESLSQDEKTALADIAEIAAESVETWVAEGVAACANRYNAPPPAGGPAVDEE